MLRDPATNFQKKMIIILILIVLILAAYWKLQNFEFVNYDDQTYVTLNFKIRSGITWKSIAGAFTDLHIKLATAYHDVAHAGLAVAGITGPV